MKTGVVVGAIVASVIVARGAAGVTVPFTEAFVTGPASWLDTLNATAGWNAAGGPDGSGAATANLSFATSPANSTPAVFRATSAAGSSGGALFGDWIAAGVTSVSVDVWHNAPQPLSFFSRYTPGGAGAVVLAFTPVQPSTWTTLSFAITPGNPALMLEGVPFATAFGGVQAVQVGVLTPAGLAGTTPSYQFRIDNVRLVPSPGVVGLIGVGGLGLVRRRR